MIRRILSALWVSACLPCTAKAQQSPVPVIPFAGTGAYSQLHTDIYSGIQNIASLSTLKDPGIGAGGVRPYLMSELSRYRLQAVLPVHSGTIGLNADLRGHGMYAERQFGLSYSRNLGTKLAAGLRFTYNSIRIAGYGQTGTPGVEAGVILHISGQVHAGLQLFNPAGGKWGIEKKERLPAVYVFGLGYEASSVFYCSSEIIKEEDQPGYVSLTFQYKPVPRLLLRAGMGTGASVTWAGAGFLFSHCRFDLFVSFHPQLGITPGAGLLFQIKKKELWAN